MQGLSVKFQDWCEKRNKITRKSEIVLFLFRGISTHFNTFVESFKKFLKTARKGFQRNRVQFGHHVFLNVFGSPKLLSFECSFHLRKEKNATKKIGIVLTVLDEALA
jgi:hypothetical protein